MKAAAGFILGGLLGLFCFTPAPPQTWREENGKVAEEIRHHERIKRIEYVRQNGGRMSLGDVLYLLEE